MFFFQGHLHSQKLKEANMRASEQILEARHIDLETKMTLDLHGLHVDEAIAALDRILPEKEKGTAERSDTLDDRVTREQISIQICQHSQITFDANFTKLQTTL